MSEIILGDCIEVMNQFPDNHFTGIVTDPPYGLKFMGKGWDYDVPQMSYWKEALRVSRPGSFLISMGGTRTFHRLACAIEDAGWEIRDCISWLYGSGFPKSHNHFGAEGFGTALKPAWEPCILAMKPLDGTFKQNYEKWGVGGLNIDACRIPTQEKWKQYCQDIRSNGLMDKKGRLERLSESSPKGRWPANLLLDEEAAQQLGMPSRFFYCAKTSSRERNEGLEGLPDKMMDVDGENRNQAGFNCGDRPPMLPRKNNHPTVKPLALMRYLITLISPPTNASILDPFAGSGSTIVAAEQLGIKAIGIEKQAEYVEIARARLKYAAEKASKVAEQMSLF